MCREVYYGFELWEAGSNLGDDFIYFSKGWKPGDGRPVLCMVQVKKPYNKFNNMAFIMAVYGCMFFKTTNFSFLLANISRFLALKLVRKT